MAGKASVKFFQYKTNPTVLLALGDCSLMKTGEELAPLSEGDAQAPPAGEHELLLQYNQQGKLLVKIGAGNTPHSMTATHYIQWVLVQMQNGGGYQMLAQEDPPETTFNAREEDTLAVYAYCNKHGLWRMEGGFFAFNQRVCSAEFPQSCIE